MDLQALIAKQRAAVEATRTESVDVVLGGELVPVVAAKLRPDAWQELVSARPPRPGAGDKNVGHNQFLVAKEYPAEKLTVGGEAVTQDQWADIFCLLDVAHQNNVHTLLWGLNVFEAIKELEQLGKAQLGLLPSSPTNRESRRAASKGGSPRK